MSSESEIDEAYSAKRLRFNVLLGKLRASFIPRTLEERREEIERFKAFYDASTRGEDTPVLIALGEPGTGKTASIIAALKLTCETHGT